MSPTILVRLPRRVNTIVAPFNSNSNSNSKEFTMAKNSGSKSGGQKGGQTKAPNAIGPAPQTNWPSKVSGHKSGTGKDNARPSKD